MCAWSHAKSVSLLALGFTHHKGLSNRIFELEDSGLLQQSILPISARKTTTKAIQRCLEKDSFHCDLGCRLKLTMSALCQLCLPLGPILLTLNFYISSDISVPLVAEKGIDLQPNTLTQVAIQEHSITRLPSPYRSKCYNSWNQSDYSQIQNTRPFLTYSITVSICTTLFDKGFIKTSLADR